MPYKEFKVEKLYYTIGEVAELLGESTSLVRFWATKFPKYIQPARNKKGNRLFTADDVNNFKIIYQLVKERGMTLDGASKKMKENKEGSDNSLEVITILNGIKQKLIQISKSIEE